MIVVSCALLGAVGLAAPADLTSEPWPGAAPAVHERALVRRSVGRGRGTLVAPVEPDTRAFPSLTPHEFSGAEVGDWLIDNVAAPANALFDRIHFPVVKKVAIFLGETKVAPRERHLIRTEQVLQMVTHLEPGDLILEKTNWYLCNLAIPGFWGHSELYIGSYDQAVAYFDDPAVNAYFAALGYDSFAGYLVSHYPDAVVRWRIGAETDGNTVRIIEADGLARRTIFNSAEHGLTRDFVAVLRPRLLSKVDKARALVVALGYLDRPYDFTFDVSQDDALTCTELLARSYATEGDKRGVRFRVERAATGKPMIFPTSLVEVYRQEQQSEDRQFSLVYFLKGDEASGQASIGSEREFVESAGWTFPF